jgi:hypothetical protein
VLTQFAIGGYLPAMSAPLRQHLGELASSFAASVLDVIRGASLEELLAESSSDRRRPAPHAPAGDGPARPTRRRGGRLPRRSAGDIDQVVERIVALVRQSPKGLRAEQIRAKLDLQAKELPRPLKEALDSGRLAKSGQKRATTYFLKGAGAPGKANGRPRRKASRSASGAGRRARRAPAARRGRVRAAKRGRRMDATEADKKAEGPADVDAGARESERLLARSAESR